MCVCTIFFFFNQGNDSVSRSYREANLTSFPYPASDLSVNDTSKMKARAALWQPTSDTINHEKHTPTINQQDLITNEEENDFCDAVDTDDTGVDDDGDDDDDEEEGKYDSPQCSLHVDKDRVQVDSSSSVIATPSSWMWRPMDLNKRRADEVIHDEDNKEAPTFATRQREVISTK